ncbi:DUF378 domain-containing protein [Candidatus Fermentibacteria bacterium]|nr:DUF378 domain-containing protein [Candidatus Fermentibacteria bacterium]
MKKLNAVDWIALILVIVGALNWGILGIAGQQTGDLIMGIIGFSWTISRIIYIVVGVAGLWTLIFTLPKSK